MTSNGLVMSQAWSLAWQEHYSRVHVMSCHIRTLSPVLFCPPTSSTSDLTDSRWQPPCFTKCWHSECHDTYLHSPLSCPTSECQGRLSGRLTSDIWLTVFNEVRGKGQKGGEERKEWVLLALLVDFTWSSKTKRLSSGLNLLPTDTPISPESLWCTYERSW